MSTLIRIACLAALLALALLTGTACKSPDNDNVSSRPWNTPRGFDTGLPGYDYRQGR